MGSMSIYHWLIVGIVVLVLFGGGGKISSLMGDFAKGIKSFKKHMSEDDGSSQDVGKAQATPPVVEAQKNTQPHHDSAHQQDARMVDDVKTPHSQE